MGKLRYFASKSDQPAGRAAKKLVHRGDLLQREADVDELDPFPGRRPVAADSLVKHSRASSEFAHVCQFAEGVVTLFYFFIKYDRRRFFL